MRRSPLLSSPPEFSFSGSMPSTFTQVKKERIETGGGRRVGGARKAKAEIKGLLNVKANAHEQQ